jgi:hypothetical protein
LIGGGGEIADRSRVKDVITVTVTLTMNRT